MGLDSNNNNVSAKDNETLEESQSDQEQKNGEVDEKLKNFVDSKFWKIRPCVLYKEEYKLCTGLRGRFNQYFVEGELKNCIEYNRDYKNCEKWNDYNDYKAAEAVILSEEARIHQRLKAYYRNNVWENRESPPEDWAKPLPEWMQKEQESSFLYHKAKEMKEKNTEKNNSSSSMCNIM